MVTLTSLQLGCILGALGAVIGFLVVRLLHERRIRMRFRERVIDLAQRLGDAEHDVTHYKNRLRGLKDQLAEQELTSDDMEYVYRSFGMKPPA